MKERMNFIYVIGHGVLPNAVQPPIKIGLSANPRGRLSSLNTASACPLVFVCKLQVGKRVMAERMERELHQLFAKHRKNGEWFDVDPLAVVSAVNSIFDEHLLAAVASRQFNWGDYRDWVDLSGLREIRRMLVRETYRRAWEALAAA